MSATPSLTVVVLITGEADRLAAQARQLLFDLRYYAERNPDAVNILIVFDGARWRACFSEEELSIHGAKLTTLAGPHELPGRMLNAVLDEVSTAWLVVLGIGTEISTWYSNLAAWHDALVAAPALTPLVAGYRSHTEGRTAANESWLVHQDDQFSSDYPHAWLQMLDLVPMCNSMVRRDFLREIGGFTEAPTLQRMWWWEFCLRASRHRRIASIPMQPVPGPGWHQYAFATELATPVDQSLRQLMRLEAEALRVMPAREDELMAAATIATPSPSVLNAISPTWRALPEALQSSLHALLERNGRPLNITIIGGVNEPAHNQLCFFNYFSLMREWAAVNWRTVLDELASADDVAGSDLVIFSRVRSENGVRLINACTERHIRTLYMLDDNWFWLGREWDEYAPLFTPGALPYENFLKMVRAADLTLTYREPLAEDLRPYAKRVVTLPTNVDLRAFQTSARAPRPRPAVSTQRQSGQQSRRQYKIGYVGSLRKNMVAFDALVSIARRRADVDIFVMSNALPDELAALPAGRVHFEPYRFNYADYAATVVAAAPDVLVAPVGHTRFEASKCPNKYLEITACGAAGVYSRAEPYLTYIDDGETGLFADDEVGSWVAAIERLLDDETLRRAVTWRARAEVAANFDTTAVLPQFVSVLIETLDGPSPV